MGKLNVFMVAFVMMITGLTSSICCRRISASETEDFNLIEYIETTGIESGEDVYRAIKMYTGEDICTNDDRNNSNANIQSTVTIDYDNEEVIIATIITEQVMLTGKAQSRKLNAKYEVLSSAGKLLYTIEASGKFTYNGNSCSVSNAAGYFSPANTDAWTSTPTTSTGTTSDSAYVKVSGTAKKTVHSKKYTFKLMCDADGNASTSFSNA